MDLETLNGRLAWRIGGTWTPAKISTVPALTCEFSQVNGLELDLRFRIGALNSDGTPYFVGVVDGQASLRKTNGHYLCTSTIYLGGDGPTPYDLVVSLRAEAARIVLSDIEKTRGISPRLAPRYFRLIDATTWEL